MIYFTTTRLNLEEKVSRYFRVGRDYTLRISEMGLVIFDASYQPPLLVEPEKGIGRKEFLRRIGSVQNIPNAYYGIGGAGVPYRCLLIPLALKKFSDKVRDTIGRTPRTIIFDAFPYDFINSLSSVDLRKNGLRGDSPEIADFVLDRLIEKCDNNDTKVTLNGKRCTFGKMFEMVKADSTYISALDFFKNRTYRENLRKLLGDSNQDYNKWTSLVPNSEIGSLDFMYVPMEIAEALTLLETDGVGVKIGDPKERGFDQLIAKKSDRYLFTYTMPAVTPAGNRPTYRNQYDIEFSMSEGEVVDFLQTSPADVLKQFEFTLLALGRLSPAMERRVDDIVKGTVDVFSEIRGEIDG